VDDGSRVAVSRDHPGGGALTAARWQEIKSALALAIGLEDDARRSYLAAIEADDPDLFREVQSLLLSHDLARSQFLAAAVDLDRQSREAGAGRPQRAAGGLDPTRSSANWAAAGWARCIAPFARTGTSVRKLP